MGWQDAPVVGVATPDTDAIAASLYERAKAGASTQPAWMSAPEVSTKTEPQDTGPSALRQAAMAPVGGAEMLLKGATGALAGIPAGLAYGGAAVGKAFGADVDPATVQGHVQNYLTYQPQSDSARAGGETLSGLVKPVVEPVVRKYGEATTAVSQRSPFAGEMMRSAPGAFQAAGAVMAPGMAGMRAPAAGLASAGEVPSILQATRNAVRPVEPVPVRKPAAPTAESIVSRMDTQQSMGAAAAAPSLQRVSPELRQAIVQSAQKTGGVVNQEVLNRHVQADSLPVPIRLTEGQATQNVSLLSHEQNLRGRHPQFAARFDEQNRQLAENVRAIRDEVGPDVFSSNPVEHGDTLIAAYQARNDAAQAVINAQYKALRDANGGQFPVDARALLDGASAQLHRDLLFDHAPKSVMSTLGRLADSGKMTFENFESLRTNLARIQRSHTVDGNEKAAAGVIRDAMEQLPLAPGAAALKPLADQARATARTQFQAIEADPAYRAAVNETVPPDRFINRFVINGARDDVARMRENLADNDSATQTLGVATLDHLRSAARIDPDGNGNFTQAGYGKALRALSPKLRSLVSARTAEQLEQLGEVARYTMSQPRGSFVNNSNTFVAAAADHAAGAAEGAANVAAGGIPVGTWTRKAIQNAKSKKQVRKILAPGAGLDRLERP